MEISLGSSWSGTKRGNGRRGIEQVTNWHTT